jgi:hypothetical protein
MENIKKGNKKFKCATCGEIAFTYPCRIRKKNYCSKKCLAFRNGRLSYDINDKRITRYLFLNKCKLCGGKFRPLHGRPESVVCSRECFYRHRTIKEKNLKYKKCTECKKYVLVENYDRRKDKKYGLGRFAKCKKCTLIKKTIWKNNNTNKIKNLTLKREYGITLEDYSRMQKEQNGLCMICGKKSKLVVDHCHKTNKVRGLLCSKCNSGLGMFNDSILSLNYAIKYVRRYL